MATAILLPTPPKATESLIRECLYCGCPTAGVSSREHIVQRVIGGTRTICDESDREVCRKCNSGPLSHMDRELCSRSHLAVIASQELESDIWQVWDIDHSANNLLVEAKPTWENGELVHLKSYPQIVFEPRGNTLRADAEEIDQFGRERFERVLKQAARNAFEQYVSGVPRVLYFEHVTLGHATDRYRFPPRVFTKRSIEEVASKINKPSFTLRYEEDDGRRHALRSLERLGEGKPYTGWSQIRGSHVPPIATFFDAGDVVRGLMKIGVNLLAAYCVKTPVTCEAFSSVVRMIRGDRYPSAEVVNRNGFVRASDIGCLARPGCHSFRLTHANGTWSCLSSFFGGRIGAKVSFPGPSREDWATLTVHAPVRSTNWEVIRSKLFQPPVARVVWGDVSQIAPTLHMQSSDYLLFVVAESARRWK